MRALVTISIAALVAAAPAAAQNQQASDQKAESKPAETQPSAKPVEKKVCKRLPQGKVCMTQKKWDEYKDMM